MSSTYEQLLRRYDRPCLPLDEVREEYLPEIGSVEFLMDEIHCGAVRLRYTRLRPSRKSKPFVYLRDLAAWLDAQDPHNQPSTTQATASDKAA